MSYPLIRYSAKSISSRQRYGYVGIPFKRVRLYRNMVGKRQPLGGCIDTPSARCSYMNNIRTVDISGIVCYNGEVIKGAFVLEKYMQKG